MEERETIHKIFLSCGLGTNSSFFETADTGHRSLRFGETWGGTVLLFWAEVPRH